MRGAGRTGRWQAGGMLAAGGAAGARPQKEKAKCKALEYEAMKMWRPKSCPAFHSGTGPLSLCTATTTQLEARKKHLKHMYNVYDNYHWELCNLSSFLFPQRSPLSAR